MFASICSVRQPRSPRLAGYLLVTLVACTWVSPTVAREWRDRKGRVYVGLLSGVVDGVVEIDANGRLIRLPFEDLSAPDQRFVRETMAAWGTPLDAPTSAAAGEQSSQRRRSAISRPRTSSNMDSASSATDDRASANSFSSEQDALAGSSEHRATQDLPQPSPRNARRVGQLLPTFGWVLLIFSVLCLIAAVAFKHIRDSFLIEDE